MEQTAQVCEVEDCHQSVVGFYFKQSVQVLTCAQHRPPLTKVFTLDQVNIIHSPSDEVLLKQRKHEVAAGKEYLTRLKAYASTELDSALAALTAHHAQAVATLETAYRAETRRVKQHFYQIDVVIRTILTKFEHYLKVKEYELPEIARKAVNQEKEIPPITQIRLRDNRLDLFSAVKSSVYYRFSALPFVIPTVSEGTALPNDYSEAFSLFAECCDAGEVLPSGELDERMKALQTHISQLTAARESSLETLRTLDAPSICRLLQETQVLLRQHKAQSENWRVEDLYEALLEAAGPESVSVQIGEMYREYADWYRQFAPWPVPAKPEKLLTEAIRVLEPLFPATKAVISAYCDLGRLYCEQKNWTQACERYSRAVGALTTFVPEQKLTVEVMLRYASVLEMAGRRDEATEAHREAISLAVSAIADSTAGEVYLAEAEFLKKQRELAAAGQALALAVALSATNYPLTQVIVSRHYT